MDLGSAEVDVGSDPRFPEGLLPDELEAREGDAWLGLEESFDECRGLLAEELPGERFPFGAPGIDRAFGSSAARVSFEELAVWPTLTHRSPDLEAVRNGLNGNSVGAAVRRG